jgi:hypothetical protein
MGQEKITEDLPRRARRKGFISSTLGTKTQEWYIEVRLWDQGILGNND